MSQSVSTRSPLWPGVPLALAWGLLFGASTPFAKLLVETSSPQLLAGLLSGGRRWTGDRPGDALHPWRSKLGGAVTARRCALDDRDRSIRRNPRPAVPDARAGPHVRRIRLAAPQSRGTGDHGDRLGRLSRKCRPKAAPRRGGDSCRRGRAVLAGPRHSCRRRRIVDRRRVPCMGRRQQSDPEGFRRRTPSSLR